MGEVGRIWLAKRGGLAGSREADTSTVPKQRLSRVFILPMPVTYIHFESCQRLKRLLRDAGFVQIPQMSYESDNWHDLVLRLTRNLERSEDHLIQGTTKPCVLLENPIGLARFGICYSEITHRQRMFCHKL